MIIQQSGDCFQNGMKKVDQEDKNYNKDNHSSETILRTCDNINSGGFIFFLKNTAQAKGSRLQKYS